MQLFVSGRELLLAFHAYTGKIVGNSLAIKYDDEEFILAEADKV